MKILITAPYNDPAQGVLREHFGEIVYRPWKPHGRAYNEGELIGLLKETQADALITEHDEVTALVIDTFPDLAFIGVCRGTPSNVSVATAKARGIPVFTTPARNAQAVAEMFVANVINLMRNTLAGIDWLQSEKWEKGAHTSYLQLREMNLPARWWGWWDSER